MTGRRVTGESATLKNADPQSESSPRSFLDVYFRSADNAGAQRVDVDFFWSGGGATMPSIKEFSPTNSFRRASDGELSVASAFAPRHLSLLVPKIGRTFREMRKNCQNCIRLTETHFLKSIAATRFSTDGRVAEIVFGCSEYIEHLGRRRTPITACRPKLRLNRLRNSSFSLRHRFRRTSLLRTRRRRKLRRHA